MAAASTGSQDVLRLLLQHGADVDAVGRMQCNAACTATRFAAKDHGVIKVTGHIFPEATAFHCACGHNLQGTAHIACIKALVRAGCDTTVKNGVDGGETGFDVARNLGHMDAVAVLEQLDHAGSPVDRYLLGMVAIVRGLLGNPEHNGERAAVLSYAAPKGRCHYSWAMK